MRLRVAGEQRSERPQWKRKEWSVSGNYENHAHPTDQGQARDRILPKRIPVSCPDKAACRPLKLTGRFQRTRGNENLTREAASFPLPPTQSWMKMTDGELQAARSSFQQDDQRELRRVRYGAMNLRG